MYFNTDKYIIIEFWLSSNSSRISPLQHLHYLAYTFGICLLSPLSSLYLRSWPRLAIITQSLTPSIAHRSFMARPSCYFIVFAVLSMLIRIAVLLYGGVHFIHLIEIFFHLMLLWPSLVFLTLNSASTLHFPCMLIITPNFLSHYWVLWFLFPFHRAIFPCRSVSSRFLRIFASIQLISLFRLLRSPLRFLYFEFLTTNCISGYSVQLSISTWILAIFMLFPAF